LNEFVEKNCAPLLELSYQNANKTIHTSLFAIFCITMIMVFYLLLLHEVPLSTLNLASLDAYERRGRANGSKVPPLMATAGNSLVKVTDAPPPPLPNNDTPTSGRAPAAITAVDWPGRISTINLHPTEVNHGNKVLMGVKTMCKMARESRQLSS
jgi:hypothetical protein